jgi:hypothetical protein
MLFSPQIFYERLFNTKKLVIIIKKIFKKPHTISELKAKATKQKTLDLRVFFGDFCLLLMFEGPFVYLSSSM